MVENPHPDGLCGKSVGVISNSTEYSSPCNGGRPTRFHSRCWSLLVDPLMGWRRQTRLAGEVALEFRTLVVFPPYRGKASVYACNRKLIFYMMITYQNLDIDRVD
jgi:hypothetical protein